MSRKQVTIDGNEAAAYIAHKTNEVIAIYPITPSSNMGEHADAWSAKGQPNLWGTVPTVVEMQSEGGAAAAVHGALQTGALSTTFTASQGLLLMIPSMFKIAGELTSTVFHVSARSVSTHALSIFGDHSDVMSVRATGWGMLFSGSVQEVMDMALIAQASTLKARVPMIHAFDGFRTSHEVMKVEQLTDDDISAMVDENLVRAHRERGMTPEAPVVRGTAQNPDVFFQGRETINPFYAEMPTIVQNTMDKFAKLVGRQYNLFDYIGAPDAERVVVMMGSGAETAQATIEYLVKQGEKVGMVKVRLFRPFSIASFVKALPETVKVVTALDRTKEAGATGEPLYTDVVAALAESVAAGDISAMPRVLGGRYGLSSKEFTPAMVKGVFDEMLKDKPKNHFSVGIVDDVMNNSIDYDPGFDIESPDVVRGMFWGLGADGTVSANKNSIKIIGEETPNFAQGHFVYDSKKSGARTVSHLRFGPEAIHDTYEIYQANFVAVHQFGFVEMYDVLGRAAEGGIFLLNSPYSADEVWHHLPQNVQKQIITKKLKFFVIDAYEVAKLTGMGVRINTIMQTCFFGISNVIPKDEAIDRIKKSIEKTYGKRGESVVQKNYAAVDAALEHLHEVTVPGDVVVDDTPAVGIPDDAPEFVRNVISEIIAGRGDALPVSAMPVDGTFPTATTQYEKRNIAQDVPVWDPDVCIQCGKCALVCPHGVIRAKIYDGDLLKDAPETFKSSPARFKDLKDQKYTLQIALEDCTGCELCVEACPAKNKQQVGLKAINMAEQLPIREQERENWNFFLDLPEFPRTDGLAFTNVKNVQLLRPLFEFSGACAGCGETPYVKLISQLFGDRAIVANATGCSSIYGGNLPTTPWAVDENGRGPAWNSSLFEDAAEFGYGFRLTLDKQNEYARELVVRLKDTVGAELADGLLGANMVDEAGIELQRERVDQLKAKLDGVDSLEARDLLGLADTLVKRSIWIMGGDGWAYDIGYGGLDHVLASGRNVNVLVMDTEVYSNTGGQASKATGLGAVAKFAAGGKPTPKKDLGMMAMSYGNVYVAQIAMGSSDAQTVKAILEAEAYDGPSIIIAYSHCIAHGINMAKGLNQQKLAVDSGHWPLYRFNPDLKDEGKNPFHLDSKPPKIALKDYIYNETRYAVLARTNPEAAAMLLSRAEEAIEEKWVRYEQMAGK